MRIVSWNIRAGGGKRIDGISTQLQRWQPDVVALSEFRGTKPSQQLAQALRGAGFNYQLTTVDPERPATNALLLASSYPLKLIQTAGFQEMLTRWLLAAMATAPPIVIGVMHVPNRVTGKKYLFHENVLSVAKKWPYDHGLLIGDTNSGKPGIDEESPTFNRKEAGWLESLAAEGWIDAFRHLHGDERVYSWYSPNGRNGFRLDQAFANQHLLPSVLAMRYEWGRAEEHNERRDALSDHAAIVVDIEFK